MEYEIRELSFKGKLFKICVLNRMAQDPSWFSFEDESGVRDRDWDIKPGDVVFDIGSAYGSYALTALASGAAFVACFNPNREENAVLLDSLNENGWAGIGKAHIHPGGVWSSRGFLRDTDQHFVGMWDASELDDKGQIALRDHFGVIPVDGCGIEPARLDWIKMDVEGAEVEVLKGAEQTIRRFKPRILVELHLFKDGTLGTQVTELLASYGYRKVSEHPYHAVAHAVYAPEEK